MQYCSNPMQHYVLYSDKTWVFDQSERSRGPIYIIILHILLAIHRISEIGISFSITDHGSCQIHPLLTFIYLAYCCHGNIDYLKLM